jgi:hemerythrin superfamily protein
MPDVTMLIETDHREVESLFAHFKSDRSKATAMRICEELDAHADAEERVFYPVVREEVPEGGNLVKEAEDEHKEARELIGRIKNTNDDTHLGDLVNQLEQAVSHHVSEEEEEMLPKSRDALTPQRREELGAEFEAAKP